MSETLWIIVGGALMTYLARVGGHLVLSRFERIHPRVEAGLNAVPAAVLTTLVAPAAMNGGVPELASLAVAGSVAWFWGGMMPMFLTGGAVLIVLRHLLG
ncbi:MAG TPA: AzlD family protein [Rhizobiales bacterium]|nr:AzlD family protein [Hyphomicrobiales bacterium]